MFEQKRAVRHVELNSVLDILKFTLELGHLVASLSLGLLALLLERSGVAYKGRGQVDTLLQAVLLDEAFNVGLEFEFLLGFAVNHTVASSLDQSLMLEG